MKTIALMPVKNEVWIIRKTLTALSQFCDAIVVADQNSTDGTRDILDRFDKVQVIENTEKFHSQHVRTLLLNAARDYYGYNLIFNFDADEIPAATLLDPSVLQKFVDLPVGDSAKLPWINLWRTPTHYRNDDSVWTNRRIASVYRDDRKSGYTTKYIANDHATRIPEQFLKKSILIDEVPVLHYQHVLFDRMLAKQRWYRISEKLTTSDTDETINRKYIISRDEHKMHLDTVPSAWLDGWRNLGLDLTAFSSKDIYWYEKEILEFFNEHGVHKFSNLDIWDVDWEAKRKIALALGCEKVPQKPIEDPRTLDEKYYHRYLGKHFRTPGWYWHVRGIKRKLRRILGIS